MYCTTLYYSALYRTALHCTVLYCIVLHYTVLHLHRACALIISANTTREWKQIRSNQIKSNQISHQMRSTRVNLHRTASLILYSTVLFQKFLYFTLPLCRSQIFSIQSLPYRSAMWSCTVSIVLRCIKYCWGVVLRCVVSCWVVCVLFYCLVLYRVVLCCITSAIC